MEALDVKSTTFYTLDLDEGQEVIYPEIPYYVASPFNFEIHRLATDVMVFVNRACSEKSAHSFIQEVKTQLKL